MKRVTRKANESIADAIERESNEDRAVVDALADMVARREEKLSEQTHWYFDNRDTPLMTRVANLFDRYERIAVDNLASARDFRDEMLTFVKAWAMIADMTANASTHQEKNARLRGMIELLESAAKKLHETKFEMDRGFWRFENVFSSDYPTLHYVRRIHELEDEVKRLTEGGQS